MNTFWRFVAYVSRSFVRRIFRAKLIELRRMDDPDQIALRFLRARKWSVTAGVAMVWSILCTLVCCAYFFFHCLNKLAACMGWRMSSDVEDIFEKGEEGMQDAEGFIKQMVIGEKLTGTHDEL